MTNRATTSLQWLQFRLHDLILLLLGIGLGFYLRPIVARASREDWQSIVFYSLLGVVAVLLAVSVVLLVKRRSASPPRTTVRNQPRTSRYDIQRAMLAARIIGTHYEADFGECLAAQEVHDTQAFGVPDNESAWVVCFDIVNGPKDWCWVVIVPPAGGEPVIYASSIRPAQEKRLAS